MKTVTKTIGERTALSSTTGILAVLRQSGQAAWAAVLLLLCFTASGAWAESVNCLPSDIGKVLGMDGKVYTTVSAAGGMDKVSGMIAYVNTSTNEGIAIGPSDLNWNSTEGSGRTSVTNAISSCGGYTRTRPSAATTGWRLPSQADFNNMIGSDGCQSADNLRNMKGRQSSPCGVWAMQTDYGYWSSTQTPGGNYYNLWSNNCSNYAGGSNEKYVRPCFTFSITDFPGSGTAADPYVISTTGQWDYFAINVNSGNTYSGKYFALGTDITVSTMAGTYDYPFSGTFNGNGHTLNLAINGTGTGGNHPNIAVAPFRYVDGATFKYLNLTGNVIREDYPTDANVSLGGLIGILWQYRSTTIIGCRSSVSLNYNFSWDTNDFTTGHEGGFIGWSDGEATFTDCLFDGSLAGRPNHQGGFIGYKCWGSATFNNCLMNGTSSANFTYSGTFYGKESNGKAGTLNNCYYKNYFGGYQGTSTNATGETLRALLGYGWVLSGSEVVPGKVLTLSATTDNNPDISAAASAGITFDRVVLNGYTLHRDGTWNTIVLPFNLATLTNTPLAGATLKTLAASNYTTQNDGTLTLTFANASSIEAGKPYIIKWSSGSDIENPVFNNITINSATANVSTTFANFLGSYAPISTGLLDANNTDGDAMHAAISIADPGKTGYTFAGWCTDAARQTAVTTTPFAADGNVTLYAKWTLNTYTIAYDLGGGSVPTDNPTSYTIESGAITLVNPTKDGYTFAGWTGTGLDAATTTVTITSGSTGNRSYTATWTENVLTLLNDDSAQPEGSKNADIIADAAASSKTYNRVTLSGRTLYKDGDWNTLCLPFNMTISGSVLDGATAKTLEGTTFSNGTLTLNFGEAVSTIEAGKPYIVKYDADLVIRTENEWNTFSDNVKRGNTYAGKTVILATDISTSQMVGGTFNGTLDGRGHTITVSLSSGGSAEEIALFNTLGNATIKNLKIAGTISFGKHRPASFASYISGTTTIMNCWSSVAITSNYNPSTEDWVDGGAFVARVNTGATINMSDCLFTGSITFNSLNNQGGGMVGWTQGSSSTANLTHCLFAPSSMTMTATDPKNKTYVFVSGEARGNLSGCYYNSVANNVSSSVLQKDGIYTTATGESLRALLGDGWEVRGGNVVPKMVSDIVNPVFTGVTISNTTANVSTDYVDFVGTYSPVVIYESGDKHNLYLGSGNNIYYPTREGYAVKAFRAYFRLNGLTAGDPTSSEAPVHTFVLDFGEDNETEIKSLTPDPSPKSEGSNYWYTIDGRKLNGKPSHRGVYVNNGHKVVIK